MGKMQKTFDNFLRQYSSKVDNFVASKPTLDDIQKHGLYEQFVDVYRGLGGTLDTPPCNVGKFDFVVDGKIIELDERAHFNRYRTKTLEADVYRYHKYFSVDNYKKYCSTKEAICLRNCKHGGYWSTPSCEKQFGKANDKGDLDGNGAPRWKQRAFYDFIKDLIPTIFNVPMFRISIYDKITDEHGKLYSVNEILKNENIELFKLIYNRITS